MEISNVTGQANIGGINSPSSDSARSSTKSACAKVKSTCSAASWKTRRPGLHQWPAFPGSQIPIPRYLFASENKQTLGKRNCFCPCPAHRPRTGSLRVEQPVCRRWNGDRIELRRSAQQAAPEVQQQSTNRPQPALVRRSWRQRLRRRPFLHAAANPGRHAAQPQNGAPASGGPPPSGAPVTGNAPQAARRQSERALTGPTPSSAAATGGLSRACQSGRTNPAWAAKPAQPQGSLQAGNAVLILQPCRPRKATPLPSIF